MKDFAKSIVCNVKAEVSTIESTVVGNYDPNDYKDDPRHKWTVKSIENEIQKYKQRIELNRVRMTQLRNMENSGNYPSSSRELKEEQKDYEANQMKVKQLVSMLRRATGNSMEEVGNAYQYAGSIPIEKIPDNWRPEFPKAGYVVYYAPNKAKWFATEAEAKRFAESQDKAQKAGNNVPDDMINGPAAAEIRETAGRVYKKEMREDDLSRATAFELAKKYKNFQKSSTFMETIKDVLKKFKTGNSKVENADIYSGTYIIMDDDGDVWFRDEHEDTPFRNIDSWAQKRIAEYQRSIDEIKKGVQEAKQAAKKFGLL